MRLATASAPAFALALSLLGAAAVAQSVPAARLRGTIVAIDGDGLTIKARNGQSVALTLSPDALVVAASTTTLAAVKPGSFIGSAAVPQPDGTQRALEVHVFPESMRGTGEGFRPWDLGPQSTMTNGNVGQIAGSDGRSLTVQYKDGEKTVIVPPDVPVVSYEVSTRAQLTPGAHVFVMPMKAPDGALTASRVTVGKDGIDLPM